MCCNSTGSCLAPFAKLPVSSTASHDTCVSAPTASAAEGPGHIAGRVDEVAAARVRALEWPAFQGVRHLHNGHFFARLGQQAAVIDCIASDGADRCVWTARSVGTGNAAQPR